MMVGFEIAGTGVRIEGAPVDALVDRYESYASDLAAPDVVVSFELDPRYGPERMPVAEYPAFDRHAGPREQIHVSRLDAEGVVSVPDELEQPVTARFRVRQMQGAGDAAIRIALCLALPRRSGLVMHSSCVAFGERALVFSGPSGAGKSTIASLLTAGGARPALADELLVLSARPGQWAAFAAPFHTSGTIAHGEQRRLAGLYFLSHAAEHSVTRLSPSQALPHVLKNVLSYAADARTSGQVMDAASDLVRNVACYELRFAPTKDVVEVLEIT